MHSHLVELFRCKEVGPIYVMFIMHKAFIISISPEDIKVSAMSLKWVGTKECLNLPPLRLDTQARWLCLMLRLGLPKQAMGWLPHISLGLVAEHKPTEFSYSLV